MTLTYLDSCILIAAARGDRAAHEVAIAIVYDPNRTFVASNFLWLETYEKSLFNQYLDQADFYKVYLEAAALQFDNDGPAVSLAREITRKYGLDPFDALHVAAAIKSGAQEIITLEKPTNRMARARPLIAITCIPSVPRPGAST